MNTYRIFEQFKDPFGEPAAKALAETLGAMFDELRDTVTKEDFRILRESIDGNTLRLDSALERLTNAQSRTEVKVSELADGQRQLFEAQARTELKVSELADGQRQLFEAQARTELKVSELAQAQVRTEAKVSELADGQRQLFEAQARTELKVSELTQAQARTAVQLAELAKAQAGTEAKVGDLAGALQRLTIRTDDVVGRTFELQFRDRLTAYLGRFFRRGKIVPNDQLLEQIEPHLREREVDEVLRADVIAVGLIDGERSHLVVEVSFTGDTEDIIRADERAQLLRRAGLEAVPLVACNAISPESIAMAKLRQVRVWCNGSLLESAA